MSASYTKQSNNVQELFDKTRVAGRPLRPAKQTMLMDQHKMSCAGYRALKAFSLFGLFSERMKTSFMGRIEAYFSNIFGTRAEGAGRNG